MKPSEQQQYYADLWRQTGTSIGFDERSRLHEIRKAIHLYLDSSSKKQPLKVFDFGCGAGWLGQHLLSYGEVHAADFGHEAIKHAASVFPEVKYHVLKDNLPLYGILEKSFDIVVATEVIEHVKDKVSFVRNLHALLGVEGCLILTTPKGELYSQWSNWITGEQQPVEEWLTTKELANLLTDNGFNILYQHTFYYVRLSNSLFDRLLSFLRVYVFNRLPLLHNIWRWATDQYGIYQIITAVKYQEKPLKAHEDYPSNRTIYEKMLKIKRRLQGLPVR